MGVLKEQRALPMWVRLVMGSVASLSGLFGLLSAPQAIQNATQNVSFLSPPFLSVVMLALAVILFYVAIRTGYSPPPQEASSRYEGQSADVGSDQPTPSTKSEERIARLQEKITENKREYDKKVVEWRQEIASAKNTLEKERQKRTQAEQSMDEVARTKKRSEDLEAERTELKNRIQDLQGELEYEQQEREVVTKQLRLAELQVTNLSYQVRYGITEPMVFSPLDEVELVVANNDMKKIRSTIDAAGTGLLDLAAKLGEDMAGGDDRNRVISKYIAERYFHPTAKLFARLCEELDLAKANNQRIDYREWLTHYYVAYNKLRRAVNQMVQFRDTELSEFVEFHSWKKTDEKFLADVGDIGVMHDTISEINKRHKYPVPMGD